jgi:hypothetical protein
VAEHPESDEVLAERAARATEAEAAAQAELIRRHAAEFVGILREQHEQGEHEGEFVDGCPLCERHRLSR